MGKGILALAAAIVGGAVAVGIWGLRDLPHPSATPAPPAAAPAVAAGPSLPPRASAVVTDLEGVPAGELRFRRVTIEAGGASAEACLVFSAPLDAGGSVRYADFVTLPAGLKAGFRVDGPRLCLSGFAFGTEHTVGLKPGLPGAKGEKLPEATDVMVGFGDRPSSVSFGPGFVLPRETSDGLPVTTVNVDRLDMKVYRVGDRLLARMREDLVDERTVYAYRTRELGEDEGRLVWSGSMPVSGPRNDAVVSLFPLADAIGKAEPGAYLVVARSNAAGRGGDDGDEDTDYRTWSGQWVVQSDLGLTSFAGADGLALTARSLHTAQPVPGVRMTLIARNNDVLAEAQTDADGKARFPAGLMRGTGGMAPVMVMAYAGTDFNFLDLRRPAFDLSDRGVDGRAPAGPVDAFLYTERGIYRPGESVELVSLLRDPTVAAIAGREWTIRVSRPDGKEYRRFTLRDQGGGAGHLTVPLPASAARGHWEATAHMDPEGEAVGRVTFEVQDFVPQRLGLSIGERPAQLVAGAAVTIPVEARFLYGAPASALGGEAELTIEPDPAPHPAHKGFRWGLADEKYAGDRLALGISETDAAGRTTVTGILPERIVSTLPLRADISIAIREPGGRATGEHVHIPLRTRALDIGIRPRFDGSVREGNQAEFDVIAVDQAGNPVAHPGLRFRILKEVGTWQWYWSGSRWRYERVTREAEIASGTLPTRPDLPAVLRQVVGWGEYRLIVDDPASGAATSVRFWGGWYGEASADRPDRLKIAADKPGYQAGETARLHVESEAAGEALLVIANERVHEMRNVSIPAGGADIDVAVRPEWGPGAYAMVTLYRPLRDKLGHAPVRAVGVAWLGLDPTRRTLAVEIGAPERIAPRQTLAVPVKVTGGAEAHVTLAAVDQGILQLTRFKTPSPQAHYLSKRRLGVGMRDDYGRLIRGLSGQGDDQGGDAFGGKGLDVVPTRTVALFSGIVRAGPDGSATIPLDIPDFQGELRLMAVAFDAGKVGSAERRLTVRDPLVAEIILPRFLAPGDTGRATILLHNVDGAGGDYRVAVRPHDAVAGAAEERVVPLPQGRREIFTLPLRGGAAGIGSVELNVSGPDGFSVARAWPVQVRPPQLPETRQVVQAMAPGESVTLGADALAGFVPGTGSVAVSLSRWQGLDVPGLLRWLDRYPFGCLEQTTSRAMPLLHFNDVALMAGGRQDRGVADRVQEAVERVVSMQAADGSFRMWGSWGADADPWLSVFALDFLGRAADKGFDVPRATLDSGRRWLARDAASHSRGDVRAYAMEVLARKGQANAGDLRYAHDQRRPEGAMALAHLGAALEAVGERARAGSAFDEARKALVWQATLRRTAHPPAGADAALAAQALEAAKELEKLTPPYGSLLRDAFGVAALMTASGRGAQVPSAIEAAGVLDTRPEGTTTQEKAWMLMAAAEMARNAGQLAVEIDGRAVGKGDPVAVPLGAAELERGVAIRNAGTGEIFRIVSAEGVPADPLPAAGTGMSLSKTIHALDGRPVDLAQIRRNDRLVVVVEGRAEDRVAGDYAILDLLPAGWEIEGVLRPEQPGYAWLGRLSEAQMRQARDDRFVAAIALPDYEMDRNGEYGPSRKWNTETYEFKVAYVVRAVTPGEFVLPAAVAEHMYLPRMKARTGLDRLVIAE